MVISRRKKVVVLGGAVLLAPAVLFWAFRKTVLYLALISASGFSLFYPSMSQTYSNGLKNAPYDVIIVPGVPYNGKSWGNIMKIRVHWSVYLYKKGIAKNIIYSGSAVYSPYYEAKVMALYGEALGVPQEHIFEETEAEHSTENLFYSYKMARDKGFTKIALATDIFQTNNLRSFIKQHDFRVGLLPIVFDTLATISRYEPQIDPRSAMADTTRFIALPERESFIKRFQGTLGKHIDWSEAPELSNPK